MNSDYAIQIDFTDDGQPKPLTAEVRYSLYQTVRELLLNVVKHAGTGKAELSIKTENNRIVVQVKDQGAGFNCSAADVIQEKTSGYGLYNVRQRIEQMGGQFTVESAPEKGTSVTLALLANQVRARKDHR